MPKLKLCLLQVATSCLLLRCNASSSNQMDEVPYLDEIENWHRERIESLKSENGWLNLAGLFWLEEGQNTFGSDAANDLVFPEKAPGFIGTFTVTKGAVSVNIKPGVEVKHAGQPVTSIQIYDASGGEAKVLKHGSLSWFVIERDGMLGIRLRDLQSPALRQFKGIERYPVDTKWRVEAVLRPYDPEKIVDVPTVLNTVRKQVSPGALVFEIEGKTHTLDSVSENEAGQLFVIFADKTTGLETYGGGRFLYVDKPDESGKTVIDFNKAYNPPCAFSEFSTCPLPPVQNRLPFAVTAGEKKYGH